MKKTVIVWGIGEIGGVFARGFLRAGYPVYPVIRDTDISALSEQVPNPEAVIIAVGEKDIQSVLGSVPEGWQGRLILVQNELLPRDWESHKLTPTVISVWFEKKYPQDYKVIVPSPVFGQKAELVKEALNRMDISVTVVGSGEDLLKELIIKNLYILTSNICGLAVGGTVGELWGQHKELAEKVAHDILDIQFLLVNKEMNREELIAGMVNAFNGDKQHKCMGRSAPGRLSRALALADEFQLKAAALRSVKEKI